MARLRSSRGFSLNELVLVMAVAATVMGVAVPVMTDVTQATKLNSAARAVERELQSARLKAVSVNRVLRVRVNCPAPGFLRTVEFLNSAADTATNRCVQSAYPFPPDTDIMTRPNFDGPVREVPLGTTISDAVLQFEPDGTAFHVVSNVPQRITSVVSITVRRGSRTKVVTVNGAGKIQLQ
jgi:Tfp pilus assembly protein FimT